MTVKFVQRALRAYPAPLSACIALFCIDKAWGAPCLPNPSTPTHKFREIFFAEAGKGLNQKQLSTLLFLPSEELEQSDALSFRDENPLSTFDRAASRWAPSQAYALGEVNKPCGDEPLPSGQPTTEPPLFIFIPELMAELVATVPFENITSNPQSPFSKFWHSRLALQKMGPATWDKSFDLATMSSRPAALSELFTTGNLFSESGENLANVAAFRMRMGSTESIGTPAETASAFLPRLSKFLDVVGPQKNIYLLGYSRGATVALEMLSHATAHPEAYPWVKNIRGVVSIAGVNFGSVVADSLITPGNALGAIYKTLSQIANELQDTSPSDSAADIAFKVANNTKVWVAGTARLLHGVLNFPLAQGFTKENPRIAIPTREALTSYLKSLLFETFQLDKPISDYFGNVRRFKFFISQFQKAVVALSTPERLRWWQTHTLPTHVPLLSLSATMGDPWNPTTGTWPLTKNPLAYDTGIFDFSMLRLSYYESLRSRSFQVHDGMVSAERTMFWPNLIATLNSDNANIPTHNLALFGVDHFGIAVESAAPKAGSRKSPFPREIMLRSLARYLSEHTETEN